jgi:hypothetical protein
MATQGHLFCQSASDMNEGERFNDKNVVLRLIPIITIKVKTGPNRSLRRQSDSPAFKGQCDGITESNSASVK